MVAPGRRRVDPHPLPPKDCGIQTAAGILTLPGKFGMNTDVHDGQDKKILNILPICVPTNPDAGSAEFLRH